MFVVELVEGNLRLFGARKELRIADSDGYTHSRLAKYLPRVVQPVLKKARFHGVEIQRGRMVVPDGQKGNGQSFVDCGMKQARFYRLDGVGPRRLSFRKDKDAFAFLHRSDDRLAGQLPAVGAMPLYPNGLKGPPQPANKRFAPEFVCGNQYRSGLVQRKQNIQVGRMVAQIKSGFGFKLPFKAGVEFQNAGQSEYPLKGKALGRTWSEQPPNARNGQGKRGQGQKGKESFGAGF